MGKQKGVAICDGNITSKNIRAAHEQVKTIVDEFAKVNLEVYAITKTIKDNWVGEGRNEFESQYNILSRHIEDFGDTLYDIYDALVEAEAEYGATDDELRQEFVNVVSQ